MENSTHSFREMNLVLQFSLYKSCESKEKLLWVGAREKNKSAFFVTFILSVGKPFNICIYLNV